MKKLNNKGITAIEILICFSIVSVIVISMLRLTNNFRAKEEVESYKLKVTTFKNTISRVVLKDIIENGGIKKLQPYTYSTIFNDEGITTVMDYNFIKITPLPGGYEEEVTIVLKDDTTRILRIRQIDNDGSDSYLYYDGKTYKLPKIPNLTFNESRILLDHVEEKNYFLKVTIGFNHPDMGNQFDAFDFALPVSDSYSEMPKIY